MKWIAGWTLLWAGTAMAQAMPDMPAHQVTRGASFAPYDAAIKGYKAADDKMMSGMDMPYAGDADRDFASHMVPHHQGAIDMAEVELKYGTDPQMKQLAGRIVAAQKSEIAFMKGWLAKHPAKSSVGPKAGNAQWK